MEGSRREKEELDKGEREGNPLHYKFLAMPLRGLMPLCR